MKIDIRALMWERFYDYFYGKICPSCGWWYGDDFLQVCDNPDCVKNILKTQHPYRLPQSRMPTEDEIWNCEKEG